MVVNPVYLQEESREGNVLVRQATVSPVLPQTSTSQHEDGKNVYFSDWNERFNKEKVNHMGSQTMSGNKKTFNSKTLEQLLTISNISCDLLF